MDKEVCRINKDIEIVIITCFGPSRDKKLTAGLIKECTKKYIKETDSNIQKKIERMAKSEYLLHEALANGDYIYYINNDKEFIFTHQPPEPLERQRTVAANDLASHSFKLKEAIQTWIDNLSKPTPSSPVGGNSSNSIISACEAHLLFQDVGNHLPGLGIDVCEKWRNYKEELLRLDEHKQHLYSSLKDEISKCFNGLDLHFIYDDEHHLEDYECYLNPLSLYDVVLGLVSGDEGFHNYEMFLSWLEFNAPIVENGDHVLWGEVVSYLRVPVKDRALLESGVPKFLAFLRNIQDSEYMGIAADITKKVDRLMPERERILKDLERAMLHANFPGECKYLG
jgi:hypothetical protein